MKRRGIVMLLLTAALLCGAVLTMSGCRRKDARSLEKMLEDPASFPISFKYDNKDYYGFGEAFEALGVNTEKTDGGTHTEAKFLHKPSGVTFTVDGKSYDAYDA
ncbi:MAG: hypothetical protein J6X19_04710 [Clostridia bacterium]|nr:hypothetical protein [Clostridia bacterium]